MKNVKVSAVFDYGSMEFTIVGLVNKEEFEKCKDFGVGYVEGSDMMTDAEGFNIHTVLEGMEQLEAYNTLTTSEVGTVKFKLI